MREYDDVEVYDEDDDYYGDGDEEWDYCYECRGYGDDYYVDEDGEFVCRCPECPMNPSNWDDVYWIGDDLNS